MATYVSRELIDQIIAGNGYYQDDIRVIKIVQYENQWNGGIAYGVIYEGEDPMLYHTSGACHNPQTIFEATSPTAIYISLQKHCVVCGKDHDIEVEQHQYLKWRSGEHVQVVWPDKTPMERESIISGVCSQECWDKLWKED